MRCNGSARQRRNHLDSSRVGLDGGTSILYSAGEKESSEQQRSAGIGSVIGLLEDSVKVLWTDNFYTGRTDNIHHLVQHSRFEFLMPDITAASS